MESLAIHRLPRGLKRLRIGFMGSSAAHLLVESAALSSLARRGVEPGRSTERRPDARAVLGCPEGLQFGREEREVANVSHRQGREDVVAAEALAVEVDRLLRIAAERGVVARGAAAARHQPPRLSLVADERAESSSERPAAMLTEPAVLEALEHLSYRERRVLELRYGLSDEPPRTLAEVAQTFRLTPERVRDLQNQSLHRLARLAARAP